MQRILHDQKLDIVAAFFVASALSLKNTFFNDFLVCLDSNKNMNRALPMIIKGNKFWTEVGQEFISQCIL